MSKPPERLLSTVAEWRCLSQRNRRGIERVLGAVCIAITLVAISAGPAHAQHGDWLLGSFGFQGAAFLSPLSLRTWDARAFLSPFSLRPSAV